MSKLLIEEPPLQVLPHLAKRLGLNEAIVLQQIHYWLNQYSGAKDASHYINGRWWVYNTAEQWQENFPFWSIRTVQRILQTLRNRGLVLVDNHNKHAYDRTLWYTINYEAVDKLETLSPELCQDGPRPDVIMDDGTDVIMDDDPMATPIPETTTDYTENNSEKKEAPDGAAPDVDTSWPVGDPPITEPTPTTPPQESILKQKDPILMAAEVARRTGGKASWTVAGPEGADPYLDGPLDATLRILRREREGLDPEARAKLARQLRRIVEGPAYEKETDPPANGTPALFLQACRLWPDEFAWKAKSRIAYSNIYKGAFVDDMRSLMCQIQDGTIGASSKLVITNA